ncbi:MAG: hypothetical protein MUF84_09785, partial [Anaerolineae bacterium]|nr:hypothetical protein [Anaerolineae bacterium]
MQLRLNGQVLQTWTVTGSEATYTAAVPLNGCQAPKTQTYTYYDDTTYDPNRWGLSSQIITGVVTLQGQGLLGVSGAPFATTRYAYDTWGNVISTTDALGRVSTTSYDATHHAFPTQSCSAVGRPEQFCTFTEYYKVNEVSITGSFGLFGQVQRTYDDNGTDTAMVQVYDAFGRVVQTVRPGDTLALPTESWLVHALREVSGQAGTHPVVSFYDGLGRAVQTRAEKTNGATQSVVNVTYDALGRAIQAYTAVEESFTWGFARPAGWDSRPRVTTQYDALGQAVRSVAADGATRTAFGSGGLQVAEDANGHVGLSHTDGLGQLVGVDEALVDWVDAFGNGTVLDGWGVSGNATETGGSAKITGNGSWSHYVYRALAGRAADDQGIVVSLKHDPGSVESAVFVDSGTWGQPDFRRFGLRITGSSISVDRYIGTTQSQTALMVLATGVWYRVLLKIDDDGTATVVVWERDNPGVRAVLRETRGEYAGRNWKFMTQVHTGVGYLDDYSELTFHTTSYVYDVLGNLTTVTDALGNVTTMAYDALGQKTSMVDPDMGAWAYAYDLAGNLTTQTNARGCVTAFTYDGLNRLTGKSYSGATGCAQPAVSYVYGQAGYGESLGRRTTMTDTSGSTTWTYDVRGRVIHEAKTLSGQPTFHTYTTYDALDRVVTTTYPDGEGVTSGYNAATQPVSLSGSSTYVSNAVYMATGALAQIALGNGIATTYTTNSASGRLVGLQVADKLSLSYGYDRVGNVLRVDEQRGVTFGDSFDSQNTAAWVFS